MTHHMTPTEYTQALHALNLTPEQAATWLGIGRSTAYRYMMTGCEGPVVVAIRERLARETVDRYDVWNEIDAYGSEVFVEQLSPDGAYIRHSDLTAAVGVGSDG